MQNSTEEIKKFVALKNYLYNKSGTSYRRTLDEIVFSASNRCVINKPLRVELHELLTIFKSVVKNRNKKEIANQKNRYDFIVTEKYLNNFNTNAPFYEYIEKNGYNVIYIVNESIRSKLKNKTTITFKPTTVTWKNIINASIELIYFFILSLFNVRMMVYYAKKSLLIYSELINHQSIKELIDDLIKNLSCNYLIYSEDHEVTTRRLILDLKPYCKCIFLQHGLIDIDKITQTGLNKEFLSHRVILWGEYYKNVHSPAVKDRRIVGSIKHSDLLMKYDFRTNEQEKGILIVSTPPTGKALNAEMVEGLTKSFMEYARELKDYTFYYKLHQAEQMSFYQKFTPPSNFKFINPESNIYELIMQCKHVVVTASTIGHEAFLFDKNLILVDVGYNHMYPFAKKIIKQGDFESFKNALSTDIIQVDNKKDYYIKTSRNIHQEILSAILN